MDSDEGEDHRGGCGGGEVADYGKGRHPLAVGAQDGGNHCDCSRNRAYDAHEDAFGDYLVVGYRHHEEISSDSQDELDQQQPEIHPGGAELAQVHGAEGKKQDCEYDVW